MPCSIIQLPNIELRTISDAANRINKHIYNDYEARVDDYKGEMLSIIIKKFKSKMNECDATDLSRLGWLLLNENNPEEAERVVKKGLIIDPENNYCQRLMNRLENTTR